MILKTLFKKSFGKSLARSVHYEFAEEKGTASADKPGLNIEYKKYSVASFLVFFSLFLLHRM